MDLKQTILNGVAQSTALFRTKNPELTMQDPQAREMARRLVNNGMFTPEEIHLAETCKVSPAITAQIDWQPFP